MESKFKEGDKVIYTSLASVMGMGEEIVATVKKHITNSGCLITTEDDVSYIARVDQLKFAEEEEKKLPEDEIFILKRKLDNTQKRYLKLLEECQEFKVLIDACSNENEELKSRINDFEGKFNKLKEAISFFMN